MNQKSVRSSWIITLICVILAAGFLLTSLLSYLATKNYVVQSVSTETLPLLNSNIYSMIERDLYNPINVSSLMANDTFLINWVLNGEEDLPAVTEYLSHIKQEYGFTSAFFVSDLTSQYYYYDGILKQISPEDDHDVWYYDFVDHNKSYELDVDTDEAKQGKLTVFINHRLETTDGKFLGVTGVGIELQHIGEQLVSYQELFEHQIYLVDSTGLIQIHSDETLVESETIQSVLGVQDSDHFELAKNDIVNIFEIVGDDVTKIVSTRYLKDLDWHLIVEKNEDASLEKAKATLWNNILIGLGITTVVYAAVLGLIKKYNQRIEYLASFDELTQVYNRRAFLDMLVREISITRRYEQPLALLMIDIDDFKTVNDQFGHIVGDQMLKAITRQLKHSLRDSDVIGRWGGDEFIALLLNTSEEKLQKNASRLLEDAKKATIKVKGQTIHREVSIGYCFYDGDEEITAQDLVKQADDALMRAKHKGRNQVSG